MKNEAKFRVMVVPNTDKPGIKSLLPNLLAMLKQNDIDICIDREVDCCPEVERTVGKTEDLLPSCDVMIVCGGDGTIIENSHAAADAGKPILGINVGRLGFLSGLEPDALGELTRLKTGDYLTEHRHFIEVTHEKPDGSKKEYISLNDLVVSNGSISNIVDLDIFCDGKPVNSYRADGVVVSSPTGSTAYALAAGGPIIHPEIACFGVTPICPHSLANRAILFPAGSEVVIKTNPQNRHPMYMTSDGAESAPFEAEDIIRVKLSKTRIDLLNLTNQGFYERINEKFR